ncbi:MAG TPA: site-specific integrase [Ohtaekwangia sp.]|uniref:site-specific integrase n=1 Tax=Ohtaekwangia sp. TaxID=2066019 RepID=UPI002F95161B
MSVKLREKKLNNGQVSLYLDIYHCKRRWYEFLDIHLNRKKPLPEDSDKYKNALEIRAKREHELIISDHGLVDKKQKQRDFVEFFLEHMSKKPYNNQRTATIYQLKKFVDGKSLPITAVTLEWLKDFEKHLLTSVSVNSALTYMQNINGALNELVRRRIIPRNPWHSVPIHERLKKEETFRTAWTIEQLQLLANTPCDIKIQYKQAFMLACFTGLRWSDINGLQWSNIVKLKVPIGDKEEEHWHIYFSQQKTRTIEFLPLSDLAIEILKERQLQIADEASKVYVFPEVKETHPRTHLVHRKVDYSIKKWAKAAGLDHTKMRFHTGRHSFATNMLESNVEIFTVSKLLGHRNVKTTQIYAQVRDRMKQAAVKSLPKIDFKPGNFLTGNQCSL